MAYDSTTGIISISTVSGVTYGVSIRDIQQALSVGNRNDIGGLITEGAAQEKINIWAKDKPERNAKLGLLTLADRQDNYFGLDITPEGPNGSISTFLSRYADEWKYLVPRGKSVNGTPATDEWFRFRDFEGYNRNANCFLNSNDQILPSQYLVQAGGSGVLFRVGINTGNSLHTNSIGVGTSASPDGLMLGGSEGTAFGALYFGLVFVKNSDSTTKMITASSVFNNDGYGSEITIPQNQEGDALVGIETSVQYTVYAILSAVAHSTMSNFTNQDRVVSLPISPFSFMASPLSTQQNIAIIYKSAVFENARLSVSFTLSMSAQGGAPTTISTTKYTIRAASSSSDTTGSQLATGSVLDLSTTQNKSVSWSGRVTQPLWVYIYAYNEATPTVNTQVWVKVREGGDIPVPVE
jgi:hypothetical protein